MLVKGILLFLAVGVLFFLAVLGIEYFLWLNSTGRFILFLIFILAEAYLLFHFILTPLFYLLKIKTGLTNREAALMIGKHFPHVGDKLYNLLDLADDESKSELLLASIEQRSKKLGPIPFQMAVDMRESYKFAKFLVVPGLVLGLVWLSGNLHTFLKSYDRVINYDVAYEQPAPFSFKLLSPDLKVLESEAFTIQVSVYGDVLPKDVNMVINGSEFLLQKRNDLFQYTFSPPLVSSTFYFVANGIKSREYELIVLKTPDIQDFSMILDYPEYTDKLDEVLKGTGNAKFPEGTKVTWEITGRETSSIDLISKDTVLSFGNTDGTFNLSKRIHGNFEYQIATSNENIKAFEKLDYNFTVVKDGYPAIKVLQVNDSLNPNVSYYAGEAADDYSIVNVRLVYYEETEEDKRQVLDLEAPNSNFVQFYYTFPSGLNLIPGKSYNFFFEATDNDAIHNFKTSKSQVFTMTLLSEDQILKQDLNTQQSIINNMDRTFEKFVEQKETFKSIGENQREKNALNFNDKNKIKDFLETQQRHESQMNKFSEQLRENLEKNSKTEESNGLLKERLARQEIQAKKNEKLLQELNKIAEKLDKEELAKRLEELGKNRKNSERNLEQLLELTKRYYITEKMSQLAKDIEKLADRQKILADLRIGEDFSKKEQERLNEEFKMLAKEFRELKKDNEDLKKPVDLDVKETETESIEIDQEDALEELRKHQGEDQSLTSGEREKSGEKAKGKQKSAAGKMMDLSKKLSASSTSSAGEDSIAEDAETLRQILDNLVIFSFKQEKLFDEWEKVDVEVSQFSNSVKGQQELRMLFEHVDDSLFSLSLRRAELSEFVNEQITEVYYNVDKALESIAEGQVYQGTSYQKYVLNASNSLADFLANVLDNMQQNMQLGKGKGKDEGFQLPDIIKGQGELKDKIEGMGESGQGKPSSGEGQDQMGKGDKEGQNRERAGEGGQRGATGNGSEDGDSKGGTGDGIQSGSTVNQENSEPNESELNELFEIYKNQQVLREQLEEQLNDLINEGDRSLGQKLLKQMEDFERDIIENGITKGNLSKITNIQYGLLKLENAALKQGKKQERESATNRKDFQVPITTRPSALENYRNEIEILNRQALPLRQNYQNKVKEYFKGND